MCDAPRMAGRSSAVAILAATACGSSGHRRNPERQGRRRRRPRSPCSCPSPRPPATRRSTGRCSRPRSRRSAPDCKVLYNNADQDAAKQQQQVEAALTQGADVLVLDAVDAERGRPAGQPGQAEEDPGHRLRPADLRHRLRRTTSRSTTSGSARCRARRCSTRSTPGGTADKGKIVMINGAPTDPSSADYKKGAHNVLDGKVEIGREFDTPGLEPGQGPAGDGAGDHRARPRQRRRRAVGQRRHGRRRDRRDEAGRLQDPPADHRAGRRARRRPADPHRRAVHDHLPGHPARRPRSPPSWPSRWPRARSPPRRRRSNNGTADIPAFLLDPIAVTADKIKDTIVKDGFYKAVRHLHRRGRGRVREGGHPVDARGRRRLQALRRGPGSRRRRAWTCAPARSSRWSATTARASPRWSRSISGVVIAGRGHDRRWTARPVRITSPHDAQAPRHLDRLPGPRALREPRRRRQPLPRRRAAPLVGAAPHPDGTRRPRPAGLTGRPDPRHPGAGRLPCPAASGSRWPSPARCSASRGWSSSTSPPPRSASSRPPRCST